MFPIQYVFYLRSITKQYVYNFFVLNSSKYCLVGKWYSIGEYPCFNNLFFKRRMSFMPFQGIPHCTMPLKVQVITLHLFVMILKLFFSILLVTFWTTNWIVKWAVNCVWFLSFIIISFIDEETGAQKDYIPCTGQMASKG